MLHHKFPFFKDLLMKSSFCVIYLLYFGVAFSQDLVQKKNIIYAKASNWQNQAMDLKLDLIYPSKAKKLSLIVNLHGGSFLDGSKEPDSAFCQRLARSGFVVANVEYRQGYDQTSTENFILAVTQAIYRAQQDEAAALRYLVHHAETYPIDTSLIFVSGVSAGGVTSLFLAYLTQYEWDQLAAPLHMGLGAIDSSGNELTDKFRIRGVINLWGGINDTLFISSQEMQATPVLLFHSVDDQVIPYKRSSHPESEQQLLHGSFDIAHRFKSNNACYKLYFIKGAKHGYGFSQNYVIEAINDFINGVRKGKCKGDEIENKNSEVNLGFGEYVDRWDKDQSKWTLLMKLAYRGDTLKIGKLIAQGQNINNKNADGWTAIKVAVKNGEINTVRYLLQNKADPNLADKEGLNSLMEACIHNRYNMASMLLENGANPNLTNIYGWTALMGAITYGDIKLMELLLKYKADVNARRRTDGMTPLRLAKFINDDQKVKLLTSYGAK
jgi:poly(3-hydroxybutyrate) depolymerase